ncbi:MAG: ribosome-associated translation inhibitor RaiA [Myxococcota bacterium]|nr:ribosome-associated translation inhibitor RaiA [Myxococcota bacterium]
MLNITFRHMEATEALRSYAEEKIEKARKYLQRNFDAQVVLSVEKFHQIAEIIVTWDGNTVVGSARTEDMYAALDEAVDKIEEQIRRSKEKRQDSRTS